MSITLSKAETKMLMEAAGRGGVLQIPENMKPMTRDRMLGRFEADCLIEAGETDGAVPRLTRAGYRAVGLRPPRKPAAQGIPAGTPSSPVSTKAALVRDLLARPEGATLGELVYATGWLPHTTRAALSRIRSAGEPLVKTPGPDGKNAYRIEMPVAAPKAKRPRKISVMQAAA